uniref:Homocysteine-responsive endoplasmic reticulum-resident ubiquitin-like domain member 2 protein n=1 Tax=Phallusia mammillata TaxID=59560 RepID=A0A6F9DFA8_9ASCI|nr:homocysteine-responsive endoplasmic reticulum-resident ubiquitin-like domain member 2 protein [Phallusia mammillata]
MTSGKVVLKIRVSDLSQEDQIVVCDPSWTVKMVKEFAHGNSGNVDLQKLKYIFGGKYLLDDAVLKTIFKISSEPQVVHLFASEQIQSPIHHVTSNPAMFNNVPSQTPQPTVLRHRHTSPNLAGLAQTTWTPEQMTAYYQHPAWQQYHQHMSQYMQYYNASYGSHTAYHHIQPQTQPQEGNVPQAAQQVDGVRNNVNNPAPAGVPDRDANPPMNAQGGFAVADDDQQNDWLDVMFTMMRGGFFLSIIYFYSTIYRFVFVSLLFLLIYIYQAGFFQPERRRGAQAEQEPPAQQQQQNEQETDDNNNHENTTAPVNETLSEERLRPEPPSVFATAWCFVTTFFTSLIPQGPPVGN